MEVSCASLIDLDPKASAVIIQASKAAKPCSFSSLDLPRFHILRMVAVAVEVDDEEAGVPALLAALGIVPVALAMPDGVCPAPEAVEVAPLGALVVVVDKEGMDAPGTVSAKNSSSELRLLPPPEELLFLRKFNLRDRSIVCRLWRNAGIDRGQGKPERKEGKE